MLYLVAEAVMPMMSTSWKASVPTMLRGTWPVKATTGEESMFAVAIPVMRLVAPGPEVAKQAPALPLALAKPSAMWAAPCSWRAMTNLRSEFQSSSHMGRTAPPVTPNRISTPSRSRASTKALAPDISTMAGCLHATCRIAQTFFGLRGFFLEKFYAGRVVSWL